MRFPRLSLLLCLALCLAACSTVPSTPPSPTPAGQARHLQHLASLSRIQQFTLKGRLAVQTDGKGYSASVLWQHGADLDDIRLYSPLGSQLARIQKTPSGMQLEDAQGRVTVGKDAESLTLSVLGWRLPLAGLADWALGRPANGANANLTWDEAGQTVSLNEADWAMDYQQYRATGQYVLPHKLAFKNPRVQLKLIVENWTFE